MRWKRRARQRPAAWLPARAKSRADGNASDIAEVAPADAPLHQRVLHTLHRMLQTTVIVVNQGPVIVPVQPFFFRPFGFWGR
jgi:hypothetical protein